MPFYHGLKDYRDLTLDPSDPEKEPYPDKAKWIANRLIALRHDLSQSIAQRKDPDSLIIGSWNLVAFDGGRPRLDESMHYIAEIIGAMDICAIQEIKPDLGPLKRLCKLLGDHWDFLVSDAGHHEGSNNERMAFVYNTNIVQFRSLVGEIVFPKNDLTQDRQLVRTPYFASFQSGWFKFVLTSAHIIFDAEDGEDDLERRAGEVGLLAQEVMKRAKKEGEVYVLLGDFNIPKAHDIVMKALSGPGLNVPEFEPSNLARDKHYDQIAFAVPKDKGRLKSDILNHGVFEWRNAVFGPHQPGADFSEDPAEVERISDADNLSHYEPIAAWNNSQNPKNDSKTAPYANFKRSYTTFMKTEMSDHLPLWVEIKTDYSKEYLQRFLKD